jgi:hypothetical protein
MAKMYISTGNRKSKVEIAKMPSPMEKKVRLYQVLLAFSVTINIVILTLSILNN